MPPLGREIPNLRFCTHHQGAYQLFFYTYLRRIVMDVGFLSVVPPLLTIALAIITKEVLLSLCIGVYTGCMIIAEWNPLRALETLVNILVGG